MKLKNLMGYFLPALLILSSSCKEKQETLAINAVESNSETTTPFKTSKKIQVLNLGTFHFRFTPDAHQVEFNEEGEKEQLEVRALNDMLAKFKPTIICVERTPENVFEINEAYQKYLKDPSKLETNYGETSMVAFEIARLNGIKKIFGIDHHMEYNYNIGDEMINAIDSTTYQHFFKNPFIENPELNLNQEDLTLLEQLKLINHPKYQEFLLNVNADILTYVGSKDGFEGADEAAKLYQRNLRMFSNINRIPMKNTDRVFILSGGLHASFIADLMKRSPKYQIVDPFDYLK